MMRKYLVVGKNRENEVYYYTDDKRDAERSRAKLLILFRNVKLYELSVSDDRYYELDMLVAERKEVDA